MVGYDGCGAYVDTLIKVGETWSARLKARSARAHTPSAHPTTATPSTKVMR